MRPAKSVLVVGGGPSGVAAAISLARAGLSITLLEREPAARHKVCGEFLSAEALEILISLGVSPALLGAPAIGTVRLCSARRVTSSSLPFAARSLTRLSLDSALLECAEAAGVTVRRGAGAQSLTQNGGFHQAVLSVGSVLQASVAILATGKHDLRGLPRPPGQQNDLVALKMYWDLSPEQADALAGSVELLLHPHGYTGLELVEGRRANLCALVRRGHLVQLGGWQPLLNELLATNPHARTRLAGAQPLLAKPLAISSIPYGFVRKQALGERLYAVGDQAAVIPSFTGDGMSIALYTGIRAAQAVLADQPAAAFQVQLHRDLRPQVARATTLSRALVSASLKPFVVAAAALWPGSLRLAARRTRVQTSALAQVRLHLNTER